MPRWAILWVGRPIASTPLTLSVSLRQAAKKLGLDQVYASSYSGLRDGRKLRIDDARHYVMFDQPAAFYGAVEAWLVR